MTRFYQVSFIIITQIYLIMKLLGLQAVKRLCGNLLLVFTSQAKDNKPTKIHSLNKKQ